jgi:hypothetical protein
MDARPLASSSVVLVLALVGCGGEDKGRPQAPVPSEAGAADFCQATAGLEFQSISDFEGDTARCDPAVSPGVMAQCFYFNFDSDNSPRDCKATKEIPCLLASGEQVASDVCSSQDPGRGGRLNTTQLEGVDRCSTSKSSFHYVGTNVATCINPSTKRQGWGATLQVTFNWTSNGKASAPYDASAWDGVSFWIRKGSGPTATALLASVQDIYTAAPPLPADGGATYPEYCSVLPAAPDAEKCDPFGAAVLMTADWRFVKLPFALLQQKGFGVPSPSGMVDTKNLVGLQFGLAAGNWDLWLDDIAFYRETKR